MRTIIVMCLGAALLAGPATVVRALDTQWQLQVVATTDSAGLCGGVADSFGVWSKRYDVFDANPAPFDSNMPEIDYFDQAHPLPVDMCTDPRWSTALYAASNFNGNKEWDFQAYRPAGDLYVTAWIQSGATQTLDANPGFHLTLCELSSQGPLTPNNVVSATVISDGTDAAPTTTWDPNTGIAGTARTDFWRFHYSMQSAGVENFALVDGPLVPVPEPSSILAMLCGISGLGGMLLKKKML